MRHLSDKALTRLRAGEKFPDLSGTRYQLIGQIARGGMGVVYAAEDETLQRRVALKVLEVPGVLRGLSFPIDFLEGERETSQSASLGSGAVPAELDLFGERYGPLDPRLRAGRSRPRRGSPPRPSV